MRALVVEDDFASRLILTEILKQYGDVNVAVNGKEAVSMFKISIQSNELYDLICLDIMMPEMDGQEALKLIRDIEKDAGITGSDEVKVVMVTALDDPKNVIEAYYQGGATSYLTKPIDKAKVLNTLKELKLQP